MQELPSQGIFAKLLAMCTRTQVSKPEPRQPTTVYGMRQRVTMVAKLSIRARDARQIITTQTPSAEVSTNTEVFMSWNGPTRSSKFGILELERVSSHLQWISSLGHRLLISGVIQSSLLGVETVILPDISSTTLLFSTLHSVETGRVNSQSGRLLLATILSLLQLVRTMSPLTMVSDNMPITLLRTHTGLSTA